MNLHQDENVQIIQDLANLHPDEENALRQFRQEHELEHELSANAFPRELASKYGDNPDERTLFFRDLAQRLWTDLGDQGAIALLEELLFPDGKDDVFIDWRRQRFSYRPHSRLQHCFHVLLMCNHLAKRCANPDCRHPFFIGSRIDERYCGDECKEVGRLATKRTWWNENRAKKSQRKG